MTRKPSLGSTKFPKIYESPPTSRCQEGSHETSSILRTHNCAVTCEHHCHLAPSAQCMWSDSFLWKGNTALITLKIIGASLQNSFGRDLCTHDLNCNGNFVCAKRLLVLAEGLYVVILRICITNGNVCLGGKHFDWIDLRFEHRSGSVK
jgi:hypothetical protein